MCLLLIDVDHFKLFNDRYGHPKGDTSLRMVAKGLLSSALRTGDLVARCGGEEFAILLPETSRCGAEHVAERVLNAIKGLAIAHAASLTARHLTVSVGVGCYDQDSECWVESNAEVRYLGEDRRLPLTAADLVVAADKALYAAKRSGRDKYVLQDVSAGETSSTGRRTLVKSSGSQRLAVG